VSETSQNDQKIRRVLAEYCFHVDDGDFAQLLELFTADAEFVFGGRVRTGHDSMLRFFKATGEPEMRGKHMLSNVVVDIHRETEHADTASALSDFVFFARVDGGLAPLLAGRYRDELRCDDERWRLSRREVLTL
jgi:3-phenylpropionate/cinnamic acid dioxygenase small subunit